MSDKHTVIIGFEDGREAVTGLNILAAIVTCKNASPAIEEIYQQFTKNAPISRKVFGDLIIAALKRVNEINTTLENAGLEPRRCDENGG